jgi:hypothetical protein
MVFYLTPSDTNQMLGSDSECHRKKANIASEYMILCVRLTSRKERTSQPVIISPWPFSSRARMYIVKSEVNESIKRPHRSYSSDRRSRGKEGREYFLSFSANLGKSVKQKD